MTKWDTSSVSPICVCAFCRSLLIQHIKKLRSERRRNIGEDMKAWHGSICIFSDTFSKEFQTVGSF